MLQKNVLEYLEHSTARFPDKTAFSDETETFSFSRMLACARSLGVRTGPVRFVTLLLSSLICAVCVSFLGIIGFVGLVAPQAVRRFLGSDHRFLLPGSALAGAALLLFADTLSRSLMAGISLPVGAITSLFGGPVFLWMLLRKKKGVRI